MAKAAPKKDDKKGKAAAKSSGGKAKKKKWSKGKVKEKANNAVLFDRPTYEKLMKEIPSQKLITPSTICERLRVNGSLARRAIKELEAKGLISRIAHHHGQLIYTRATASK